MTQKVQEDILIPIAQKLWDHPQKHLGLRTKKIYRKRL